MAYVEIIFGAALTIGASVVAWIVGRIRGNEREIALLTANSVRITTLLEERHSARQREDEQQRTELQRLNEQMQQMVGILTAIREQQARQIGVNEGLRRRLQEVTDTE